MAWADTESVELLRRYQESGDRELLEVLFERYLPRVRTMVALRMGRRQAEMADVDDIVQDVMIDVFNSIDNLHVSTESTFIHWITTIVVNRIRDDHRRRSAAKRGGGIARTRNFIDYDDLFSDTLPSCSAEPHQEVERRELEERIEVAFLALSERSREVLAMRQLAHMSYDEIAAALNLGSTSYARALASRALRELSDKLGGDA